MSEADAAKDAPPGPDGARIIERPDRWGLMPTLASGEKLDLNTLLRYWFVQFNPLYFVSAFCVLYGVFLVSRNVDALGSGSPERAQILLFGVIQAYEALIIFGAWFLVNRARVVRPAVLLALLESVFMFDCTFRLEGIGLLGDIGKLLMGGWLLLTLVKVRFLSKAMRVPLAQWHYGAIAASAAGVAAIIGWLSQPGTDKLLALQVAAWFGAFVMLWLTRRRPRISSTLSMTDDQRLRSERCINGLFRLLVAFYFYHLWSYIVFAVNADIIVAAVLSQAGAFTLLQMLVRQKDRETWRFGALTLAAAFPTAVGLPYALFVVGAAFGFRVWSGARNGLAVGAACAVFAGMWLYGWHSWESPVPPLPSTWSWQSSVFGIVLGLIGWLLRDMLAWTVLAVGGLWALYTLSERVLPRSELGLGILLLIAGFVVFMIGIAVNWWFRAASPGAGTPSEDAKSSQAG